MRGRKSRDKPPFLHILEVGNDTGQLLKHAFKSLPGVQIHVVSPHQKIICADIQFFRQRFLCQTSGPSEFSDPLSEFHLVEIHIFVLSACCGEQKIHSQDPDRSLSPEKGALKKETHGRKESHSKDMVIPSVPEASHVIYLA